MDWGDCPGLILDGGVGFSQECGRGLAAGLGVAELLGGGEDVVGGSGGRGDLFERAQGRGLGALGDELLAFGFDAGEGIECRGCVGGVEPGFEFAQGEGVDVAEVEGGEVGVEEFCEEEGGVEIGAGVWGLGSRGRSVGLAFGVRQSGFGVRGAGFGTPVGRGAGVLGLGSGVGTGIGAGVVGRDVDECVVQHGAIVGRRRGGSRFGRGSVAKRRMREGGRAKILLERGLVHAEEERRGRGGRYCHSEQWPWHALWVCHPPLRATRR